MRRFVSFLIISSFVLLIASCSKKENPAVLLIPGYGSKALMWEESGIIEKLVANGYKYGGSVKALDFNIKQDFTQEFKKGDIYNLVFSDSTQTVENLSNELAIVIKGLREKTNNDNFLIVAYSMGGLIARNYLVNNFNDNYVETLITLATPHLGSYLANILYASTLVVGGSDTKAAQAIIDVFGIHSEISINTLKDLVASGKDSFLHNLNMQPHPENINYVSIIAHDVKDSEEESVWDNFINIFKKDTKETGDSIISAESQNMANIDFFEKNKFKLKHKAKHINASHLKVFNRNEEISQIIIEELERFSLHE